MAEVKGVAGSGCYIAKPRNKREEQLLWLEGLEQAAREVHAPEEKEQLEGAVRRLKAHLDGSSEVTAAPSNSSAAENDLRHLKDCSLGTNDGK